MNISAFVKSLLPFFNRNRMQDDLRNTTTEFNTIVLPSLQVAAKELRGPFKSPEAKNFQAIYKQAIRTNAANYAVDLATRLPKLEKTLEAVAKVVNTEVGDKVVSAGMNVRVANAVRVLGALSFINKFTLSLLNATVHYELKNAGLQAEYISDVTEGELRRLQKHMVDYVQFLEALTGVSDPDKAFADIPDVLVEAEAFKDVFGSERLDPFRVFGQSNFRGSPFYIVNMMVAEYQHNQYRKMEAQKQALEKRIIALRRLNQGQASPQVERELEVLTSRIASIGEELRKYEESLA